MRSPRDLCTPPRPQVPSSSPRSERPRRCTGRRNPRRSPRSSHSWPPRERATSPAPPSPQTADAERSREEPAMRNESTQSPEQHRAHAGPMADAARVSVLGGRGHAHNTAPTRFVEAGELRFAYRRFGNPIGTPLVLLQHFMGNLDSYDPAITDVLAADREVILTDNAGVGRSTGAAPDTVAGMARDAASLIDALGLAPVDLFGFSMGGYVAQQIALDRPELVRRLILVGTGPRGGEGMDHLAPDVAPLFSASYEPRDLIWLPIFFSESDASQAA